MNHSHKKIPKRRFWRSTKVPPVNLNENQVDLENAQTDAARDKAVKELAMKTVINPMPSFLKGKRDFIFILRAF